MLFTEFARLQKVGVGLHELEVVILIYRNGARKFSVGKAMKMPASLTLSDIQAFHFCNEFFFFSPADFKRFQVVHNHEAAFTLLIFLDVMDVDNVRTVDTCKMAWIQQCIILGQCPGRHKA
jgi:hypothetical protein